MAGLRPRFEKGPISFLATSVANGGNIRAGRFVEFDGTTGKIKPAVLDSEKVLGLCIGDASASDYSNADTTDGWGNTVVNAQYPPNDVAVAYQGVWDVEVAAGQTVNPGDLVACVAGGLIKPWDSATGAPHAVVGRSISGAAVTAGNKARIRLAVL